MHRVDFAYPSLFLSLLILLFVKYNAAHFIDPIPRDGLYEQINADYGGDEYEENNNENLDDNFVDLYKRDIIKGPSFIPNLDATTADTDIAYENNEVSEEGARRSVPEHSRSIKVKDNIEDNLDAIETLMKDDSELWESPKSHKVKDISHFIRHKKNHGGSILDERAAKKNLLSKIKHDREELPKKVIKALYDWKEDGTEQGYRKSNIFSNFSAMKSHSKSYEEKNLPSEEVDSLKPFLTENGFTAGEGTEAEPVIPAVTSARNSISPLLGDKMKKNIDANDKPGRRSKVDVSSIEAADSSDAESPDKRYHLRHRKRGHRRSHTQRRPVTVEEESGEGSASGAGDATSSYSRPNTYMKPVTPSAGTTASSVSPQQYNSAPVAPPQSYAAPITPVQDKSAATTATQDNTATAASTAPITAEKTYTINQNAINSNLNAQTSNTNTPTDLSTTQTAQVYASPQKTVSEAKPTDYQAYQATTQATADDDSDASGSGSKEPITKEISYKVPVTEGDSENANETDSTEKDQNTIAAPKEAEVKETETKEAETKETETKEADTKEAETKEADTKEAETKEAETKEADVKEVESKEAETKDAEVKEAETKETEEKDSEAENPVAEEKAASSEQEDKTKTSLPNQSNANDDAGKKEKLEDTASNTDGTDNMKKKSGQEDKYETLEEVREKFKKWESTIVKSPNEPSDDSISQKEDEANARGDDAETEESSSPKNTDNHVTAKSDTENNAAVKTESSTTAKAAETKQVQVAAEQNEEKKVEETEKAKTEIYTDKKVNNLISNKGEAVEEKVPEEAVTEKQPDDLVKELIGVPTKQTLLTQKTEEPKEAKDVGVVKSNQEGKQESSTPSNKVDKPKIEIKEDEKTSKSEGEDKFNMEEVNKKNKEHHDLPDSDMKEGAPEKFNMKPVDVSNLNSSNVPGVNEQPTASEEKPIAETNVQEATGAVTEEKSASIEKNPTQAQTVEEKITEKVASNQATEEKSAKPTSDSEGKLLTKTAITSTKHGKQASENKPSKLLTKIEKKTSKAEKVTKVVKEEGKEETKQTTGTEGAGDTSSTEFGLEQEKPMINPQITKEANEFSNEQEKSFASAIEKIKAQEEKLKGKEISSEIQEIKEDKNEAKFGNVEETFLSPKSKKHSSTSYDSKKPSEKNLKQLRLYKHQILSEVEKINDLMNEYHKDGHSTKELSEAKDVLENDLKLVKELERNTKKKSLTSKKEKIKVKKDDKQSMPSSAYLNTANDDSKDDLQHRDKTTSVDSKTSSKSLEKEAERNEKQLANLIPSYEYYFHSDTKPAAKHPKKQSLEEIHKLLKAEIKRLRQKKNSKADNQLKNIRKLVQQHLKKLISTGDIDKNAFHSLAPEIKQLGELLKERIKSLKKKKIARKIRARKFKENAENANTNQPKVVEQQPQPTDVQQAINVHHHAPAPVASAETAPKIIDRLDPPLDSVKGLTNNLKTSTAPEHSLNPEGTPLIPASNPEIKPNPDNVVFNETIMSAIGDTAKQNGEQNMNIKNLLQTLNEKLGSAYQKAKDAHDIKFTSAETKNAEAIQDSAESAGNQEKHHGQPYEETPAPPAPAPVAPPAPSTPTAPNAPVISVPPPATAGAAPQPAANQQQYPAQKSVAAPRPAAAYTPPGGHHPGDQRQNVEMVSNPQVIDATEPQVAATQADQQVIMNAMPPSNAQVPAAESVGTASIDNTFQAATTPIDMTPVAEPPPPTPEAKAELPMVPEEAEFDEDNTEALASLEPINTLVETLEKDITELWSYKDLYPNAESLGLDNEKVHNTYANLGSLSGLSLRRALNRALRGEDVGLGVVGGSISKGGPFSEKGLEYVLRSYFYAIEDYWNKVIRPITGSSMIVRDVSLGGISTDYYSFCIRNHLPDDKLTNIVLWELSANDMRRYDDSLKPKPQPLEQFTRNILTYRAKPSLIFVNFFALFDWDPDLRANCRNFEDEGEDDVAKYYKITSLSWRNMVCPLLKSESNPIFTRNNLFAEDHFHPSILGHAQMSYIVIDYIRTEFLKNLVKMRPFFIGDAVEKLQIPRSVYMPRPMFKETFLWKPLCYTYMLVDNRLPNNTMPLHEENESDFKYTVVRGFKIRSDKIAGMETKLKDQFIRYKLQIPRHEDGGLTPFKQLGIMSFTDDRYAEVQFDSQHPSRLEAKKRFLEGTVVKTIAENIEPGEHTLTVRSGDSGFLICALVLG